MSAEHPKFSLEQSKHALIALGLSFFILVFLATSFASARSVAVAPDSFADMVEVLTPAVVNVSTSQKVNGGNQSLVMPFGNLPDEQMDQFKEFFERFGAPFGGMGEREVQSLGSGFVIDPKGYIVTNNHVVEQADQITVRFQDDTKYEATLVGRDPKTDLALLKIEVDEDLPFVSFGDSDEVRVGDWTIAIGNPYGLGGSVTAGIISARSRNINAGPFDDFLQTDAAINRGNSGGPMFNIKGEVIGVNTAIFSPTGGNVGIGFAVPSSLAKPVLAQLKQYGRTHRGWLGVKIQHVTEEIADSLGLDVPKGALVLEVTEDSPADKANIKAGDVIVQFDEKTIKEMRLLPRIVAETKIGKKVDVEVWREGRIKKLEVTLGELDESDVVADVEQQKEQKPKDKEGEEILAMRLGTVNKSLRKRFALASDVSGVIVFSAEQDSSASKKGIKTGDVIVAVVQDDVRSVDDFKRAIRSAREDGKKYVLLRILRGEDMSFVTLPLQEEE